MGDLEIAVLTIKNFCKAMGAEVEFIKVSRPIGFKSIHGVEFREYVFEDEADYWRHRDEVRRNDKPSVSYDKTAPKTKDGK